MKKIVTIFGIIIGLLVIIYLLSLIPTISLKTDNMHEFKGKYVNVYYEKEKGAAKDVFELAEIENRRIAKDLDFSTPRVIKIYIYDNQKTFQTKKYGYIASCLNMDWYIGDNIGTNVLLTSPANPGKAHSYDDVKAASIHEMVHAYNSVLNSKMPLWLNEGIAVYLSDQKPRNDLYSTVSSIPTINQMHTSNPIKFSNIDGYSFSYTYIEYLVKKYGWNKVVSLARTSDYDKVFNKSENEIYKDWINYLKNNYTGKST